MQVQVLSDPLCALHGVVCSLATELHAGSYRRSKGSVDSWQSGMRLMVNREYAGSIPVLSFVEQRNLCEASLALQVSFVSA